MADVGGGSRSRSGGLPREALAAYLVIVINQSGTGLLFALVPLRLATEGFPASTAGLVSTAFSIGFIAGCLAGPAVARLLGSRRAMIVFGICNALAALALWATSDIAVWVAARGLAGFGTASLFTLLETWLAALASEANRGRMFALYMVINRITFSAAQMTIAAIGSVPDALMLVAVVAYLLAPLPAQVATHPPPSLAGRSAYGLFDLARIAPAAAAASFCHGIVTVAAPGLFPVLGIAEGWPVASVALALVALQIGGLGTQALMIAISDRFDRRQTLIAISLATALAGAALAATFPSLPLPVALVLLALWGGLPSALYSVGAAHANDLADEGRRLAWSSSMLLLWGVGAASGPLVASLVMDATYPRALIWFTAGLSVALALVIAWRRRRRP
jgi:MFS family permease